MANIQSLHIDAAEELRDILGLISDSAEKLILGLSDRGKYKENISELFRYFHSLKALAAFLELENMKKSIASIEDILSILRQKNPPIRQEIIDWLLQINDQVLVWHERMERGIMEFEPIDAYTLSMVKSTAIIAKKPDEILKELNVLYLFESEKAHWFIEQALKGKTKSLRSTANRDEALKILGSEKINIIIIPDILSSFDTVELAAEIRSLGFVMQIIVVSEGRVNKSRENDFIRVGVEFFANDFMRFETLLQKLNLIAKQCFEERSIRLSISPVFKKISNLKPLPTTVNEVQKLKSNPNATVKDLTGIVTKDPIVSAKIIKFVNSPLYGFRSEVSSLHHAISLLGKEKVFALTLQSGIENSIKLELESYGISQEQFFRISYLRMNFMMNWFPKVNLSKSATMVTAAVLGNIGQILIADEVKRRGVGDKFLALLKSSENQSFAEMEFCNTTSQDVTADMLTHWGLEAELAQVIRYSFDFASAPDDIKPLSVALYAVYELIPGFYGEFMLKKADELRDLLAEMNFNPEHFMSAIDKSNTARK